MAVKEKKEIEIADGVKVFAQTPIIVSASRSTDIPAFYGPNYAIFEMVLWGFNGNYSKGKFCHR